jgi:hypothetical protein
MREKEIVVPDNRRGFPMADQNKSQTFISAEEVLKTEIIVNQALIDILIAKQIISEKELLESMAKIRMEQGKMINDSRKIVSMSKRTVWSRSK